MLKNCGKGISVCLICKKDLPTAYKTFCSWDCRTTYGIMKRTSICKYCSKEFTLKKGESLKENSKYCSVVCTKSAYSGINNHSWKGVKEDRSCLVCNEIFIIKKSKDKESKLYCTRECKSKRVIPPKEGSCLYCNIKFNLNRAKQKHCSRECANKTHSIKMLNKNNPNYSHGNANNRYPAGWNNRFKELIRTRDEYKCQLCYMTEEQHSKKLCVHHINFDRFDLNPENLITLCKYCHGKFHGKHTREKCKEELLNLLKERNKSLTMCIT